MNCATVNCGDSDLGKPFERQETTGIPLGIFSQNLGTLETITKYLKENKGLRINKIALLLNRNQKTIWGAYNTSRQKNPEPLENLTTSSLQVPITAFCNRSLGMLESLVVYLKEMNNIPVAQIAVALKRDYNTIWTTCLRAKTKRRQG